MCARGVAAGALTVGDTVLFLTLMAQLYAPLNYFGALFWGFGGCWRGVEVWDVLGGGPPPPLSLTLARSAPRPPTHPTPNTTRAGTYYRMLQQYAIVGTPPPPPPVQIWGRAGRGGPERRGRGEGEPSRRP